MSTRGICPNSMELSFRGPYLAPFTLVGIVSAHPRSEPESLGATVQQSMEPSLARDRFDLRQGVCRRTDIQNGEVLGMIDTTEIVQVSRQQEVLNAEPAHRMKNVLAMVTSTTNQTLKACRPAI